MGVRVVAAPVRYPSAPLIALLVIAVIPAVGLLVLYRWAADEAERYNSSRDAVAVVSGAAARPGPTAETELATTLLDYRRTPERVAELASVNRLSREIEPLWGFLPEGSCATVAVDGHLVGEVNPELPVIPASNQKLIVGAVALDVIGSDTRFTTKVLGPAPVDGVITGDVYLVGGGDPLLTSDDYPIENDKYPPFHTTSLDQLADQMVAAGVTRIDGVLRGDGSRYDDEYSVDSWGPGVAFVDAGPYDALMANDSHRVGYSSLQSDPVGAAASELARMLAERGVYVNGGISTGEPPRGLERLARVRSAPLTDAVEEMLVNSDNNTAEMLVKEIGFADRGEGTRVAGLNVIDAKLRAWDIPMEGVRVLDGSGLSPENRVTCAAMMALLQHTADGPLPGLLPVAGESGTLSLEFLESPMAGTMRAKTGSLPNPPIDEDPPASKALAGYVDTPTDATIEFVMILNSPDITEDRAFAPLWQALGDVLATYPAGPSPDDLSSR